MNGNNIFILVNGTIVAATTSDNLSISVATKNVSSPMSGKWKRHRARRKAWSVNTSWFVTTGDDVSLRAIRVGTIVDIAVQTRGGDIAVVGKALCMQCDMQFAVESLAKGAWSFKGVSAITINTASS